ncbi:MAG TPA: efflux transporter outer membrane subunit [Caulobacteraceae bacterium]|nr:efflux transporter outer membrane subunit [Caulobacteraceae bacterium]
MLLACLLASGCAVGPNFAPPPAPTVDRYPDQSVPARLTGGGSAQTIELGRPTPPNWWRLFGSPALDDLVATGLKSSPTLASARQALQESEDQARAGAGVFFPSVDAAASAVRERTNPVEFGEKGQGSAFSLYTLTGAVSYALDLFGGERRQVEALNAQADYQRNAAGAAYLLLTGNIVDAAVARAGYADQVATLADIVKLDQGQCDILKAEYDAGTVAWSAELAAEQQLDADEQILAQERQRLAASVTLLQTLTGREPAEASPTPPALDDLTVPPDTPVSLPSQLVRERPDILEAEANLHQASAQVGVATAALFPSISITGDYGAASTSLASLASPMGRFWSVGPTIDVPIFRGGELWYGRKAAQAAYAKAAADYRQTVLAALEQVADSVKALGADAEIAQTSREAFDAAALDSKLSDANRASGLIADFDAMTADIATDRARLALIAAKSQRLQDVVALYLASGGGWTGQEPRSGQIADSAQ